ncbi:hypothetical protein Kpol_1006p7 [Vanderwaltozyma polyspora DSM 70294]|uniref:General negative regulator of transcription subunit 5 n=1 Tax=Vanderwaltozyma polyspora (strain ATCC 22028 / DSM 70294 / BCRC 21397 / CBS 2163 / NBRC 10782 / NRRL Y-8283 / UCD 57-17) TaxID=436907 RepID=A7TQ43_VANPO|nr:uncharacterized protein Kpol_1006p7 [Vanderwaltozyma polyspora DSM 70294]EDO15611.1 hypothetical protein Kpol_1006p7 [Vanderwaltozyma polyspora DSM 70294]
MSQRKLQQDIDKLLKKVKEGLEDYDEIYEKFQSSDPSNTSYREKLESDLKREIKKLQKHRDQIKTWLSKEDVKDKQDVLMENRRLIEIDMEKFKSVEKLMKTKQFSTEALTNPDIIKDPKELKKRDQFIFIQDCLEELQKQLESYEAKEDQTQVERHEFHISNLENILKLLQNDDLEAETVEEFQDDIRYYVDNNDDPDFIEYDTIYEDMNCEIKEDADSSMMSDSTNANTSNSTTSKPKKQERSPRKNKTTSSMVSTPTPSSPNLTSQNINDSNSSPTKSASSTSSKKKEISQNEISEDREISFPPDISEQIEEDIKRDISQHKAFKNPLFSEELKYWLDSKRPLMQPYKEMPDRMVSQLESSLLNCPDSLDADTPYLYRNPLSLPHPTSIFFPSEPIRFVSPVDSPQLQQQQNTGSNESIKSEDDKKESKPSTTHDIYSRTSLAKTFSKFDLDTLFFIFYHYQGTYEQFLVARELAKHRNWKFNKINRNWYYKEVTKSPPGMQQAEEETWRYFDYQNSWLARRCNSDFKYNEEDFEKL